MVTIPQVGDTVIGPNVDKAYTQTAATADDFGGGIGTALTSAGTQFQKIADQYQTDQNTLDTFNQQKKFIDFSSQESTNLANAARSITPGGQGFTKSFMTGSGTPSPTGAPGSTPAPAAVTTPSADPTNPNASASPNTAQGFDARAQAWISANTDSSDPKDVAQWQAKMASLRSSVAGSALSTEFAERDNYYKTQVGNSLDQLQNGIDQSPNAFNAYKTQGQQVIASSGLSGPDKEAQSQWWDQNAALAYGISRARQNPAAVAAQLGSQSEGYYAKLSAAEGGSNPTGGNGGGAFQFEPATWTGLVNSPAGKAAGLTADGRQDPAQGQAAARIFTEQNAATLAQQGLPADEKNLRMTHFLGAGDGPKFLQAMAKDPTADAASMFPAAAGSNKSVFHNQDGSDKTLGQVFAGQTAGFQGGAAVPTKLDPIIAGLPMPQQQSLLGTAEREAKQQSAFATTAATNSYNQWFNDFQLRLNDGKAGLPDIQNARASGVLTDYGDISKAQSIVESRNKGVADVQSFNARMADPASQWNGFNTDDKRIINAGVKALGNDPATGMRVYERTGVMPDVTTASMRGDLASNDTGKIQTAANTASNMLSRNPNAFASVKGGDDLEKAGVSFNHYVNDLGMTADQATQRIMQQQAAKADGTANVKDADVQAFKKALAPNAASNVQDAFKSGIPLFRSYPQLGIGEQAKSAISRDYMDIATDAYQQTGDKDIAQAMATQQMKKLYGVSNGVLVKYPPENAYPPIGDDGTGYVYRQAADDIKATTGATIDPKNVYLMPLPTATAQAFRSGQPTPYSIHYVDTVDGQPMQKTLLGKGFVADPQKEFARISAGRQASFNAARSVDPNVGMPSYAPNP